MPSPLIRRRRTWWILGLSLIVGLGASAGWATWDRSPPRRVLSDPASWPQGFTPDGRSFLTLSPEGMTFWDPTTGQARHPWSLLAFPISAYSQDGRSCVGEHGYDSESAKIAWVDVASGAIKASFAAGLPRVLHVSFTADDRAIRAFLGDQTGALRAVVTWDLASGAETRRPLRYPLLRRTWAGPAELNPVAYAADGSTLAYLDPVRNGIQLWDVAADQPRGGLLVHPTTGFVPSWSTASFSPDGRVLAVSRDRGAVDLWDLAREQWVRTIPAHADGVISRELRFSPDGRTLALTGTRHAATSWADRGLQSLQTMVHGGHFLLHEDEVVVVDVASGARLARWPASRHPRFSPDGRTIVTHESRTGRFAVRDVPQPPGRRN